jgi:hypothetical protein
MSAYGLRMASVDVEAHFGMQMNTKPWVGEIIIPLVSYSKQARPV